MTNKIWFLISRLRNASPAELMHRVREGVFLYRQKKRVCCGEGLLPVPSVAKGEVESLLMPDCVSSISVDILKEFLQGRVSCLNGNAAEVMAFGERNQKIYFSVVGQAQEGLDIRAVWEPARLQNAAALIYHALNDPGSELAAQCREYAKVCVLEWIKKNPFLYGPHYKSAMECGLRVPVFFAAIRCLDLGEQKTSAILSAIYHHAWWVEKRLSLYSSLGNHTVCECVGLVFAGTVFQKSEAGKRWLERGIEMLRQELEHQILPDGGPAEQSLSYHRFVLDLYWLVIDFLEKNGLCNCNDWKPRLASGERFLAVFQDVGGNVPSIGDSDDGYAIAPGVAPRREARQPEDGKIVTFPDAGYTVIRSGNGMHLTFDHGPLGMAPLYNHGHADALSVTLSLNGEQFLVDPGTYRYNGVPEYRKYFKGTRAHNTVTVDGLDQAVQETGFIWSKPFVAELVRRDETEQGVLLEAIHNGYERLKQPVRHKRIILFVNEDLLLLQDTFSGQGIHEYELNFHLHPGASTALHDGWWHLQKGNSHLDICLLGADELISVCGQESPVVGWYSPEYGLKEKSVVLQARKNGCPDDVTFVTAISLIGPTNIDKLERLAKIA